MYVKEDVTLSRLKSEEFKISDMHCNNNQGMLLTKNEQRLCQYHLPKELHRIE
jgi:hypothetical protein